RVLAIEWVRSIPADADVDPRREPRSQVGRPEVIAVVVPVTRSGEERARQEVEADGEVWAPVARPITSEVDRGEQHTAALERIVPVTGDEQVAGRSVDVVGRAPDPVGPAPQPVARPP